MASLMESKKCSQEVAPFHTAMVHLYIFLISESDIRIILSFEKADIYRLSQCSSTGNTKINKTVSVFKGLTTYC